MTTVPVTDTERGVVSDHPWLAGLGAGQGRALAALALAALALGYFFYGEAYWRAPRDFLFDSYQRWVPRAVQQFPVAIIDIDDESVAAVGRWPWPRDRLAQLVQAVHRLDPLALGLDIIMPEPDRLSPHALLAERRDIDARLSGTLAKLPSNDQLLADALSQGPSVVARAALLDAPAQPPTSLQQTAMVVLGEPPDGVVQKYPGQLANVAGIEAAARGRGYVNDTRDSDGVLRRAPLVLDIAGTLAPAFAIELLRVATGRKQLLIRAGRTGMHGLQIGSSLVPTERDGRVRIYYSPVYAQRRISAAAILRGTLAPGALKNQVAIIGTTALGTGDIVATPVAPRVSGVEVHAQLIENILGGSRLVRPAQANFWELLCLIAFGGLLILFVPKLSPIAAVGWFTIICALLGLGSFLLFYRWRWLIDPSFSAAGSGAILGCLLTAGYMIANRRRRELGAALALERDERMRIDGELRAAREIQMGMLPNPTQIAGLPPALDLFALVEPAQEVGGDFYEAMMLDEHRLFFMIGDVSGKGMPAALFMALTKTLGKSIAQREAALDRQLSMVNAEVSRENPAALFVTAIIGIVDARTGGVEWCNAGHNPPLLLRENAPARELEGAGGPPLCVLEDFLYPTQHCQLAAGDMLLFITDGVSEAENGARQRYGWQRARDCFLGKFPESAEGCCRMLDADIKQFVAAMPSADDLTILAIGYRPAVDHP